MATKKANKNPERIALIAFDSVVKLPKNLKSLIAGWKNGGPILPVEFSRISNDGRLTPVIDARNGTHIQTMFTVLKVKDLNRAITEVAKQQGITNNNRVGYLDIPRQIVNADCWARHEDACRVIVDWAKKNKFSAVVWNGLGVKFKDAIGVSFSPQAAVNSLNSLKPNKRRAALKYIKSVPKFVDTRFRNALNEIVH